MRQADDNVYIEQRFLEVDRATLSVDRLAAELVAYARLFRATKKGGERLWRERYPVFPPVICVLEGASRPVLERRRNAAFALLDRDPEMELTPQVEVSICLAEDLREQGPNAPIFASPGKQSLMNWLGQGPEAQAAEPPAPTQE